ncbi:MAG: flagellar biosynthesis anti-sigma factor FlgM [Acidobacteriota bacterium]|nr:flagellar biosynthesis anti-sigma factor FlgM [Acidobacteriota bacterium]
MNISFPNGTTSNAKVESQKTAQTASQNATRAAGEAEAFQGASGSELSLSGTSVQALKAQLATLPEIRLDLVQSLRMAVENGTYNASSNQIAAAMHSDLFGAPSNSGS